jgi:hypothetical protein
LGLPDNGPDKDSIKQNALYSIYVGTRKGQQIQNFFGSKLYLFPCKNYSIWGLLFSVFWFVKRHSFKPHTLHFQLNYECDVIFTVPQICAYFVDQENDNLLYA